MSEKSNVAFSSSDIVYLDSSDEAVLYKEIERGNISHSFCVRLDLIHAQTGDPLVGVPVNTCPLTDPTMSRGVKYLELVLTSIPSRGTMAGCLGSKSELRRLCPGRSNVRLWPMYGLTSKAALLGKHG